MFQLNPPESVTVVHPGSLPSYGNEARFAFASGHHHVHMRVVVDLVSAFLSSLEVLELGEFHHVRLSIGHGHGQNLPIWLHSATRSVAPSKVNIGHTKIMCRCVCVCRSKN